MKCWYEHVCLKGTWRLNSWYIKRIQMYCKSDIDSMKALKLSTHLSKTRHPIYCFYWSKVGTNQVIININYVVFWYLFLLFSYFAWIIPCCCTKLTSELWDTLFLYFLSHFWSKFNDFDSGAFFIVYERFPFYSNASNIRKKSEIMIF